MSNPSPEILKTARVETAKVAAQAEKPDIQTFAPESPESFADSFWYDVGKAGNLGELRDLIGQVGTFTFDEVREDGTSAEPWTGAQMASLINEVANGEVAVESIPEELRDAVIRVLPKHEPLDIDSKAGDAVFVTDAGKHVGYDGAAPAFDLDNKKRLENNPLDANADNGDATFLNNKGKRVTATGELAPRGNKKKAPLGQTLPKASERNPVFVPGSSDALRAAMGDLVQEEKEEAPAVILEDGAAEKFQQAAADTSEEHLPEVHVRVPIQGEPSSAEDVPVTVSSEEAITAENSLPQHIENPELNASKEALEAARNAYLEEYRVHHDFAQSKSLLSRIKSKLTGSQGDPPPALPESLLEAKRQYDSARQAYGEEMLKDRLAGEEMGEGVEQAARARVFRDVFLSEYKLQQQMRSETLPPVEKNLFVKSVDWWAKRSMLTKIAVSSALIGAGGVIGAGIAAGLSGMTYAALGGTLFEKVSNVKKLDALRDQDLDRAWASLVSDQPDTAIEFAEVEKRALAVMKADEARRRTREMKRIAVMVASGVAGVVTMKGIMGGFSFGGGEAATAAEAATGVASEAAVEQAAEVVPEAVVETVPEVGVDASVTAAQVAEVPVEVAAPAVEAPVAEVAPEPVAPVAEAPVAAEIPTPPEIPAPPEIPTPPEVAPVVEAVPTPVVEAPVETVANAAAESVAAAPVAEVATEATQATLENVTAEQSGWFGALHENPYTATSPLDQAKMMVLQKLSGAGIMGTIDGMAVPSPLVDRAIDGVFGAGNVEGWNTAADILSKPEVIEQIKALQAEAMADPSKVSMIEAQVRALFPRS